MGRNVVFLILLLVWAACVAATGAVYLSSDNMASLQGGYCCWGPYESLTCGAFGACTHSSCRTSPDCVGDWYDPDAYTSCAKNDLGLSNGTMLSPCGQKGNCGCNQEVGNCAEIGSSSVMFWVEVCNFESCLY